MDIERETAAMILQRRICDAICYNDINAERWLCINNEPMERDLVSPGFVYCCNILGLKWQELKSTLKTAITLEDPPKPHLTLVPKSELQ
jgi:hypothetical protein